ncbi:uncharacterized protein LOC113464421 [Ceratina calcarata]|uniref:Uncharacterized protein LOC113464421 n=1 Tax=Ceratina calcarata TaxID=156304 RepID=A0AAJ7S1U8_9HYME|nr:uncharacterized protein LOC113464421 [Ceratina calcarata]
MHNKRTGAGLINTLIDKLPFELHVPGYQFCGPDTRLEKRLAHGDPGINPLDTACREHDIAYSRNKDLTNRHKADQVLTDCALQRIIAKDVTFGERAAATAVWTAMKTKTKLGIGLKTKNKSCSKRKSSSKKKKRVLPIARRGGFLPFLLPALSAIGALTGGAAGVAKAVNDVKATRKQLEEVQRHNRAMEGRGLYLVPYKKGSGLEKKKI